jgi:hypothetical protein
MASNSFMLVSFENEKGLVPLQALALGSCRRQAVRENGFSQ